MTDPSKKETPDKMSIETAMEYGFLGCLLDYGDTVTINVNIATAIDCGANASWFGDDTCRLVWTALEAIWKSSGGLAHHTSGADVIQQAKIIAGQEKSPFAHVHIGVEFFDLAEKYVRSKNDMPSFAAVLRQESIKRQLKGTLLNVNDSLSKDGDAAHTVTALAQKLTEIVRSETESDELSMEELTADSMNKFERAKLEYVDKRNFDFVTGLPLPWRPVSRRVDGLQSGVTIIAARPSVGKSSFTLFLLEYLAEKGYRCVFNCLDMSAKMIVQRPFSTLSGIPLTKLKRGLDNYDEVRPKLLDVKDRLDGWSRNGFLKMKHTNDVDKFKSWCIMRREQGLLDVVAIDYIQQLTAKGRFSSDNERLTYISGQLKDLATTYDIPVLVLSQLSRDNVKDKNGEREPTMADLRGSGSLEQDAFMVILLYQDSPVYDKWRDSGSPACYDVYAERDKNKESGAVRPIWVKIEKNQNGEGGKFPFVVFQETFNWFLGDYNAEKGQGPLTLANEPKFTHIYPDWRNSELERSVDQAGGLVQLDERRRIS